MDEVLQSLTERLDALDDVPVAEHADVLDEVHAAIVAELDAQPGSAGPAPVRGGEVERGGGEGSS